MLAMAVAPGSSKTLIKIEHEHSKNLFLLIALLRVFPRVYSYAGEHHNLRQKHFCYR